MPPFEPLSMMRAIRDDENLTATQRTLLWAAVLRTDNATCKVRASLELLAKDAGVARETAVRAFKVEHVVAYFARIERQTRRIGLWFGPTSDTRSPVTSDRDSPVGTTSDPVSATSDRESHHLPVPLPTSKQAAPEVAPMDDADWLAAELDEDPAACRRAIDHRRRQAADRGNPWRSPTTMVRRTIPLDEWRPLVQQCKPRPRRKPSITGVCGQTDCPGTKHTVETDHHLVTCFG